MRFKDFLTSFSFKYLIQTSINLYKSKWDISPSRFIIIVSLINLALYQLPLFLFANENLDLSTFSGLLTLVTLFIASFMITVVILSLLFVATGRNIIKYFCIFFAFGNALALYFVMTYHVILGLSMMGNLLDTNVSEATSYFQFKIITYLILLGLIPSYLLMKVSIQKGGRLQALKSAASIMLVALAWAYLASSTWLWYDKNAKSLGGLMMPWSYVGNSIRQQMKRSKSKPPILLPKASFHTDNKLVVVLVIGESARAENFSLYQYDRLTNPMLAKSDAVALANTSSCSTYTTKSVRCILSHQKLGNGFSQTYEPLPNYLQRQGVDVIWRSHNSGAPALKVHEYQTAGSLKGQCQGSNCDYDEVLLSHLKEKIQASDHKKTLIILHQSGSHGPSYHEKYPKAFEKFKPVCKSVDLHQCTNQSLINTYDNTILYTDYFLSKTIETLKNIPHTPTLMIYISDHGESLGEYGLYLHGTPFSIAPNVQKEVPFIVWMSDAFKEQKHLTNASLTTQKEHNQHQVFHSIMGAFDMYSSVYDPSQDIFYKK